MSQLAGIEHLLLSTREKLAGTDPQSLIARRCDGPLLQIFTDTVLACYNAGYWPIHPQYRHKISEALEALGVSHQSVTLFSETVLGDRYRFYDWTMNTLALVYEPDCGIRWKPGAVTEHYPELSYDKDGLLKGLNSSLEFQKDGLLYRDHAIPYDQYFVID